MQYRLIVACAAAIAASSGDIQAQVYPSKPLRIVTLEAGGGNDNVARLIAGGITPGLGQQVIVDNRAGASGIVAVETASKATPDGYTMLSSSAAAWVLPLMQSVPYDLAHDLATVSLTGSSPGILVVHPSLPVRSVKELIAYAKAKPGQLNYGVGGSGSVGHFSAELFKSMAGVDIERIAYKSGNPTTDLLAGRLQLTFTTVGTATPNVKSGKLRALAVTSAKESELMPGVPPLATEGLPGYEMIAAYGLFVPAKTPAAIVARLNRETVQALRSPDTKARFFQLGIDVVASSPQELAAYIQADQVKLAKLIKEAGITPD